MRLFVFLIAALLTGCGSMLNPPNAYYEAQETAAAVDSAVRIAEAQRNDFEMRGYTCAQKDPQDCELIINFRGTVQTSTAYRVDEGATIGKMVAKVVDGVVQVAPFGALSYVAREGLRQAGDILIDGDGNELVNDTHETTYASEGSRVGSADEHDYSDRHTDSTTPQQVVVQPVVTQPEPIVIQAPNPLVVPSPDPIFVDQPFVVQQYYGEGQ